MSINTLQEKFQHELGDIYDAEHQFLKGQEEMLKAAADQKLKDMITTHIQQTQGHIKTLEQVYSALGMKPERVMCDAAKGLVSEGQKMIRETQGAPEVCDCAIAGAASKVEHYEIASYRGLITGAEMMGQQEVVSLLQKNLEEEESTAQLIEQSSPELIQKAMSAEGTTMQGSRSQATPTH